MASRVYSEQVGRKRHDGGKTLETVTWYSLIIPKANSLAGLTDILHPIAPRAALEKSLTRIQTVARPDPSRGRVEQTRPLQCPHHRILQGRITAMRGRHPGDEYAIPPRPQTSGPKNFAQAPLHAISGYGIAHATTHRKPVPGTITPIRHRLHHQWARRPRAPLTIHSLKLLRRGQHSLAPHSLPDENNDAGLVSNDGETQTPFQAARLQNIASAAATHSLHKPVLSFARNLLWLISPLRHFDPSNQETRSSDHETMEVF
jgi:hypothetical protein